MHFTVRLQYAQPASQERVTFFHDALSINDEDFVGVHDGGESVRDGDGGPAAHESLKNRQWSGLGEKGKMLRASATTCIAFWTSFSLSVSSADVAWGATCEGAKGENKGG
jgi:hypothetical protein